MKITKKMLKQLAKAPTPKNASVLLRLQVSPEMVAFGILMSDLRRNKSMSPWVKAQKFSDWLHHIQVEKAELNDAFIDNVFQLALLMEESDIRTFLQILVGIRKKPRKRKPWIFGPGNVKIPKTAEAENKLYLQYKKIAARRKRQSSR